MAGQVLDCLALTPAVALEAVDRLIYTDESERRNKSLGSSLKLCYDICDKSTTLDAR